MLRKYIDEAFQEADIKLIEIIGLEKENLLLKIMEKFVNGDPRAWWLSFKTKPNVIDYDGDYAYMKLEELFNSNENLWFIIDEDNVMFYVFYGTIKNIQLLIEESIGFEYYIVKRDFSYMVCENDHGALLEIWIT